MRFADLYKPGLLDAEFNQIVYYKNIGMGIVYGFLSIVIIFMVLEDDLISADGRVGYLYQSGAVLFFNIILVANFRILVMSSGISWGLFLSVLIGMVMYWLIYIFEGAVLEDFMLKDSIYEEWTTFPILLIHFFLIFCFVITELAYDKYWQLQDRGTRTLLDRTRSILVSNLLLARSNSRR